MSSPLPGWLAVAYSIEQQGTVQLCVYTHQMSILQQFNTPYPASQTSSLLFIIIVNCLMRIIIATLTIYTSREHNHGYILQYGYMLECSEVNKKIILHLPPSRTVRLVAGLEIDV